MANLEDFIGLLRAIINYSEENFGMESILEFAHSFKAPRN
jgi:hypothetical protein